MESISAADMIHKLIRGLLFLLAIVALERLAGAQEYGKSSQPAVTEPAPQAVGFDNPLASDCFSYECQLGYDAIGYVILGYLLGAFIGVVRAATGECCLRPRPAKVLNI